MRGVKSGAANERGSVGIWIVVISLVIVFIGVLIIAIRGGNTITQLNALKSKVSQLEESSSALDAATVKELKAAVESLQAKTANLPDNVKAELEDIVARIAVLEEGGTTSSGGSSSSSALTCKNGTCLSLQAGNTTVQETGSINISGSAKIGGSVTADLFYGDGSNLSNLTATQLTTGTIADARLSTNVAMLGNTQTFTGQVQFSYAGTALTVSDTASIATLTVTNSASVGANLAVTGTVTAGSFARSCPTGYVPVPGNPKFGTSDFCVMQYEAKDDGSGNAVSTATGTPWVSIAQYTAEDEAQSAGGHLLTDAEWVTIAENALMQSANWCSLDGSGCNNSPGTVSKFVADGHNDGTPNQALVASATNSEACYGTVTAGTNTTCGAAAGTQKRTLTLSNGSVIWDFAGNVWEWTKTWVHGNEQPTVASPSFTWRDFTDITRWQAFNYANPTNRGWNSTQRLGQIYSDGTSSNTTLYGFIRGGNWSAGTHAGIYALELDAAPTTTSASIGFRVAR